jgi:hypothetical protein
VRLDHIARFEQLFWNGTRQDRLALMLGVSQQEVSRRKVRVSQLLRQTLNSYAALLLSQLGSVCLASLDDLDVTLDVDFCCGKVPRACILRSEPKSHQIISTRARR